MKRTVGLGQPPKRLGLLLIVWSALSLTGCSAVTAIAHRGDATKVANSYFEAVKRGDDNAALATYSPLFFDGISQDDWRSTLTKVHAKLGSLEKYDLADWKVKMPRKKPKGEPEPEGKYYVLEYETKYSNNPHVVEVLTLFEPVGGQDYQIVSHEINSQRLFMIGN